MVDINKLKEEIERGCGVEGAIINNSPVWKCGDGTLCEHCARLKYLLKQEETLIKERHENLDSSSGDIYPVNSEIQGRTFETISSFIRPRKRQLIKQVSYTMEVEYYPENLNDVPQEDSA